jgi:hypothetical protein
MAPSKMTLTRGRLCQVSNRLYAYNNRITGERTIGSVAMTFVKLADARLGETEVVETPDGINAVYCSRVRSLVDAVYDWSRFNSLPQGYDWIRTELARDPGIAGEIARVASRYAQTSARFADSESCWNWKA